MNFNAQSSFHVERLYFSVSLEKLLYIILYDKISAEKNKFKKKGVDHDTSGLL